MEARVCVDCKEDVSNTPHTRWGEAVCIYCIYKRINLFIRFVCMMRDYWEHLLPRESGDLGNGEIITNTTMEECAEYVFSCIPSASILRSCAMSDFNYYIDSSSGRPVHPARLVGSRSDAIAKIKAWVAEYEG